MLVLLEIGGEGGPIREGRNRVTRDELRAAHRCGRLPRLPEAFPAQGILNDPAPGPP